MFEWFWKAVKSSRHFRSGNKKLSPGNFVQVGTCRVCEEGALGVRVCSDSHRPLVMCEECESIWESPDTNGSPKNTLQPNSTCPICKQPMFDPPAYWASQSQIEQLGWGDAITGTAYQEPSSPSRNDDADQDSADMEQLP